MREGDEEIGASSLDGSRSESKAGADRCDVGTNARDSATRSEGLGLIQTLRSLMPEWVRTRWPAGTFVWDSGVITAGAGAGQVILLVASPVLTRLYTPGDFGVLAVYSSALTILLVVASLRWELAIPLPKRDNVAIQVLVLAFASLIVVSGLCAIASLTLGSWMARSLGFGGFSSYVWVLAVGVAMGGAYQVLSYWAIRREDYAEIGKTKFAQNTGEAVTQVAFGVVGLGPIGLLLGDVIGRVGGSSILARPLFTRDRWLFGTVTSKRLRELAARYRRVPLVASGASLINSAGAQLPPILLATAYGSAEAGLFMVAFRVVAAPAALVGRGVSQVYMGNAAKLVGTDHTEMKRLVRRICGGMLLLGIVPALVLVLVGVPLFAFVFGEEWTTAGSFVRPLSLVLLAQLVVRPVSQTLNILERQGTQFLWDIARLLAIIGAILVPAKLGAGAETSVTVYSVAATVMYAVLLATAYWGIGAEEGKEPTVTRDGR